MLPLSSHYYSVRLYEVARAAVNVCTLFVTKPRGRCPLDRNIDESWGQHRERELDSSMLSDKRFDALLPIGLQPGISCAFLSTIRPWFIYNAKMLLNQLQPTGLHD